MIRNFSKDFMQYLPAQIVPTIVGLISLPIFTHLFLPADYGNYTLVVSTVSILCIIVGWLSMAIIRYYQNSKDNNKLSEFYGNVIILLILSIAAVVFLYFITLLYLRVKISPQLWDLFLLGIPLFIFSASCQTLLQFLRASRQINYYTIFSASISLATFCIGLVFVMLLKVGVNGLILGLMLSNIIILPFLLVVELKDIVPLNFRNFSIKKTKEMMKYGFPLMVGNLAAWILDVSDRFVLKIYRGSGEVGIYSAHYTISQSSILLFVSLITLTAAPLCFKIWEEQGEARSQKFMNRVTRYYLLLGIPIVIGISILAKPITIILTPVQYLSGYPIISLIAVGVFFLGLEQLFQFGLLFYKKTFYIMLMIIFCGLLNLGLNFWLVPKYGYIAAAFSTLVSYVVLFISILLISKRFYTFKFPLLSSIKILFSSLFMGALIFIAGLFVDLSNILYFSTAVITGIIIYISLLLILKEPRKEELHFFKFLKTKYYKRKRVN